MPTEDERPLIISGTSRRAPAAKCFTGQAGGLVLLRRCVVKASPSVWLLTATLSPTPVAYLPSRMTLLCSPLAPAATDGVYTDTSDSQSETEQLIIELISKHLAKPGFNGTPSVSLTSLPFEVPLHLSDLVARFLVRQTEARQEPAC